MIPNSDIYIRAFIVHTAYPAVRSEYDVGIGYSGDIEATCTATRDAMRGVDGVEYDPAPKSSRGNLPAPPSTSARWWTRSGCSDVVLVRGRVIAAMKDGPGRGRGGYPIPTRVVLLHHQT